MAISTYAELQAAVASWSFNRTDLPATDLISLAETRLNRDLRLRVMETEAPLTGVVDSRYIALPTDFRAPIALFREDSTGRVPMPQILPSTETFSQASQPEYWTIDGSNVAFERPCDDDYEFTLRYVSRLALSDSSPTNWLLTNHPDAYLAASLVEAALWAADDEQAVRWNQRLEAALGAIRAQEAKSRQQTLRTDVPRAGHFDIRTGDGFGSSGDVLSG